jgi:hypothetical protein
VLDADVNLVSDSARSQCDADPHGTHYVTCSPRIKTGDALGTCSVVICRDCRVKNPHRAAKRNWPPHQLRNGADPGARSSGTGQFGQTHPERPRRFGCQLRDHRVPAYLTKKTKQPNRLACQPDIGPTIRTTYDDDASAMGS